MCPDDKNENNFYILNNIKAPQLGIYQYTKLNKIKNNTNQCKNISELNRKEGTSTNGLRIGHCTRLTHSFLMTQDEPPSCDTRGDLMTVNHIMTECQKVNPVNDLRTNLLSLGT